MSRNRLTAPVPWPGLMALVLSLAVAATPAIILATAGATQDQEPAGPDAAAGATTPDSAAPAAQPEPGPESSPSPQQPPTPPATRPGAEGDAAVGPRAPAAEPHESFRDPVLAERLAEMGQWNLREREVTEAMWRQSAALLEAATRLGPNPRDPRFHRLLIEARLKLEDFDGAIRALTAYRRVDPADRIAQIQLVDLYVGRMQTADVRLQYLRDLLDRPNLPPEVRSHVATLAVPLLMERSPDEAMAMLDEALRAFPLSPEALRLRYDMIRPDTAPAQRAAVLLSLLRSNPAQPDVAAELGGLLASLGMANEAVEWYSLALRLYPRLGKVYPEGFVSNLGAQLLFTGQNDALESFLASYIKALPDDADAWFIRLVKERASGEKVAPQLLVEARRALTSHWSTVADRVAGREPQKPQPAGLGAVPPGGSGGGVPALGAETPAALGPADPSDTVRRLKAGEAEDWKNAFVTAASDLAWFELFFAEDAEAAAPWVGALKELLPGDNLTVARLEGWLDLIKGRAEEAKGKLSPIADRDPLAALGIIRLAGKDANAQAQADDAAAKLRAENVTGLVAAMVWSSSGGPKTRLPEASAAADVRAELQKFPRDWLEILNQPTSYYRLGADVLKVAHRYGEPLLAVVTIQNLTDFDLTIGPEGVIRPDLWVDARLGGLANQAFPGVAYDRVARKVVLRAREATSQLVRVDQGVLGQTLAANPSVSIQVFGTVLTNPVPTSSGVGPGPAGTRQPLNKALSRSGFAVSQGVARKRLLAAVTSGTSPERLRTLDLLAAYVRMFGGAKELDETSRATGAEFIQTITRSREDAIPAVSVWATYQLARLSQNQRPELVEKLLADDNWPARLLGVIASTGLPPGRHAELVTRLAAQDPDPVVREFAAATAEYLKNPPATQPATQPATEQPAGDAGGELGGGSASPSPTGPSVPSTTADDNTRRGR